MKKPYLLIYLSLMSKSKLNFKDIFSFIVFISTTYLSTVWINFYYLSTRNVDFHKYYGYINYFLGADVDIDYGQGSLYFYLIASTFKNKLEIINEYNFETIVNYSVQNINLLFYIKP